MEKFKYEYSIPPKHLTKEEYDDIITFIAKATEDEIQEFLDVIKVKFSGEDKGIDREQVMFVVDSDTDIPEIKQKMLEFVRQH